MGHTLLICGTIPNCSFCVEDGNKSCEIQHINPMKTIVKIGFRDKKKEKQQVEQKLNSQFCRNISPNILFVMILSDNLKAIPKYSIKGQKLDFNSSIISVWHKKNNANALNGRTWIHILTMIDVTKHCRFWPFNLYDVQMRWTLHWSGKVNLDGWCNSVKFNYLFWAAKNNWERKEDKGLWLRKSAHTPNFIRIVPCKWKCQITMKLFELCSNLWLLSGEMAIAEKLFAVLMTERINYT